MQHRTSVLVLGGNGFIGRHAVAALVAEGANVSVGSRHKSPPQPPGCAPGTGPATESVEVLQVRLQERLAAADWRELAERFDVILNCVGILRQRRGETYDAIHHRAPAALAKACSESNTRFVHVSALGLSATARSRFLTSKWHGDEAILQVTGQCFIARLSLLDGDGGFGASWLRAVAKLPVFVVPTSARGQIAALTATDAGTALARLCLDVRVSDTGKDWTGANTSASSDRLFELGGTTSYGFGEYLTGLRQRYTARRALAVPVPGWLARGMAHLCDVLHFSPFSFGHWELLCEDNVPQPNRLPELLGREPQAVIERR